MKKITLAATTLMVVFSFTITPVWAEGGWKFSDLNPFASVEENESPARSRSKAASDSKSGWSWSAMNPWGGSNATARSKSQSPSTWDKMTSAPKNAWSKTKPYLMPWDKEEKTNAVRRPLTGTNVMPGYSARKPEPKKGFFDGWFSEESQETRPKTVNDFLAQPRPEF